MLLDFLERLALIEKKSEFVRRERFQSEQVAETVRHIFTLHVILMLSDEDSRRIST